MVEYSTPESALAMGGLFDVSERSAGGLSPDDPAVPLLVCRPVGTGDAVPVLYYVHGGGMGGGRTETVSMRPSPTLLSSTPLSLRSSTATLLRIPIQQPFTTVLPACSK